MWIHNASSLSEMVRFKKASFNKNFFVTTIDMRQEHRSPFHSPSLHFLVHIPIYIWCSVVNCSHRCQHARSRCVRTANGQGDRFCNRHVHNFVVLFDFEVRLPVFDFTARARKTTACTIALRTEYSFRDPIPCPSILVLHAWQVCFQIPTHGGRRFFHRHSSRTA